jgi:hypothetical protein
MLIAALASKNWIAHGMPWNSVNHPPDNWDPRNQLRSIGVSIWEDETMTV